MLEVKRQMIGTMIAFFNDAAVRRGLYPVAVGMCAGAIFILSVIPGFGGGINSGFSAHATAYFVLSLVLILYLRSRATPGLLCKAVMLAGAFGACIEGIQYLIPYRTFEWSDILMNACAAGAAALPGRIMIRRGWI